MHSISRRRHIGPVLLLGFAIALAVLLAERSRDESGLEMREMSLGPPFHTPLVSVKQRGGREDGPVALLLHGFQCNKSMMLQIAKFLAQNGVDSYLIDLPGHGASTDTYTGPKAIDATAQALWYLMENEHIRRERIAMVGHSYGAMIASYIGIRDHHFRSHVLIGPGYVDGFALDAPKNVLVLLAERDHSYVKEYVEQLLRDATGREDTVPSELFGSYDRGDARLLEIVPDVGHVGLIWSGYVFDKTREWIEASIGDSSRLAAGRRGADGSTRSLLIAALSLAIATLVVFEVARHLSVSRPDPPSQLPARALLIPPLAAAAGVGATRLFVPLEFLRLHEGDIVASCFLNAGVAMAALAAISSISMGWFRAPRARDLLTGVLLGALAATVVYASTSLTVTPQFYQATFSGPTRVLICLVLFAAFLPFFCVSEVFFRSIQARFRNPYLGGAVSLAAYLLFSAFFLASIGLLDAMLWRFAAPLVAVLLYAHLVGAVFHRRLRSSAASGVFSSLLAAWVISVGFLVT